MTDPSVEISSIRHFISWGCLMWPHILVAWGYPVSTIPEPAGTGSALWILQLLSKNDESSKNPNFQWIRLKNLKSITFIGLPIIDPTLHLLLRMIWIESTFPVGFLWTCSSHCARCTAKRKSTETTCEVLRRFQSIRSLLFQIPPSGFPNIFLLHPL